MRGEVKHFTSEQKSENTYGWPWNEVVKKYLESGYLSEQEECQITIRDKDYKVLKRREVTCFYDSDGNTLFDVTNERLKKEYESKSEDSETAENKDSEEAEGNKRENAKQKLDEELKKASNKAFAVPVIAYLKRRCDEDLGMAEDVLQTHKTWDKCFSYIYKKAKENASGTCAAIPDDTVYEWAEDYYHVDDKAIEAEKAKKRIEQEEKRKTESKKKKTRAAAKHTKTVNKSTELSAKEEVPKREKTVSKKHEPAGQMSLFDWM